MSWRGLLRHIYRRQGFWTDFADNQPVAEQNACILQFVGAAEHLFTKDLGDMVANQKQIWELQARKDEFLNMLHEVSRELLDSEDQQMALTPESIASAISRVRTEIEENQQERAAALTALAVAVKADAGTESASLFDQNSERLAELRAKSESVIQAKSTIRTRIKEVEEYRVNITQEIDRLKRAQVAGETLAPLKVTHCPACDQGITPPSEDSPECYVCHRPKQMDLNNSTNRINFELEHLDAEQREAVELVDALRIDYDSHLALEKSLTAEQKKIEVLLNPVRQAAAAILPPELTILDVREGQLQQRLTQLIRLQEAFSKRQELTKRIQAIEKKVTELEAVVEKSASEANLEEASDWLSDGMNDYCNALNKVQSAAWPLDRINARLSERRFDVFIGKGRWKPKLGGTLTLYFFLAYHYSLLKLTNRAECHYPGVLILDFPPVLEDGSSVHDKENFVLEPFVELTKRPEYADTQVIAAGSSFENLAGANRIELKHVWTEGGEIEPEISSDAQEAEEKE